MRRELMLVRYGPIAHGGVWGGYRRGCSSFKHSLETSVLICCGKIPCGGCTEWEWKTAVARIFAVSVLISGLLHQTLDRIKLFIQVQRLHRRTFGVEEAAQLRLAGRLLPGG
jgi:hypothetical protein